MNWKTIKTFLIFLFLAVDIFLIVITYRFYNMAKLSDQAIQDTITLLQRNNITIDAAVIPRDAANTESIQLTNLYYSDIANTHKSRIKFTDNGMVSLTIPADDIQANSHDLHNYIINKLDINGFDTKNTTLTNNDGKYSIKYSVNGLPVFNNSMTVTAADNMLQLTGNWYINEKENTYAGSGTTSTYATSALIEFISHPSVSDTDSVTVTNIDMGYYADVSDGAADIKIISASPCYRLTTDSNKVYYYSINDSKFIN